MLLVYITCKDRKEAEKVSMHLLKKRIIGCANIFPIRSMYWWNCKIANGEEAVIIAKTNEKKSGALEKEVRDIERLRQILAVLFEEGFDFLLSRIGLRHHVPVKKILKRKLVKKEDLKPEVRLRRTLERLGPTFIKLGQVLSVRPDLVPKEYCKELEKLQDKVPPIPFSDVKSTIEKEFGRSIENIFSHFDKEPVASASISQVHKATLKTGQKVAVKVQRP